MKKKDIIISCIWILTGIGLIILGLTMDVEYYYGTMMIGSGVGAASASVSWLIKHIYDTRPENIEAYQERMRELNVDKKDERKNQLRHQAGYITWLVTTAVCFFGASIAAWLRADKIVIAILLGIAILEYLLAFAVYKFLCYKM